MNRDSHRILAAFAVTAAMLSAGCASVNFSPTQLGMPSLASEPEPIGSPGWWKKHKSKAEFVPGEGYRVAGAEGYFDQEGRPISAQVSKVISAKDSKSLLADVEVVQAVANIKTHVGMGPDQKIAEESYAAGEELFRREEYAQAAKEFERAADRWPDSKIEQDALFFLGESQFFDEQYPEAVNTYGKLLEKNFNTPHLNKVIQRQFEIARYWEQHHQYQPHWATTPNVLDSKRPLFDTLGRAMKTYENIRLNDPTGPLSDDALMATANSYFLRGRYNDADSYYDELRRDYPRSPHQYEAHVLGLQCKIRKYQGPDYDETPLLEAKKLVKQLKQQFAGQLNDTERERLSEIQGTLVKQLAAREFKRAKFYDDTAHYESAKFHYAELVRQYPRTPLAEKARTRIEELGGKPAHPPTKLGWASRLASRKCRTDRDQTGSSGRSAKRNWNRQPPRPRRRRCGR